MKKIVLFIVAVTFCSAQVFTTTRSVPGSYATIQAAITAASAGDIIDIAAGTYTEKNIACTKAVTIQGAGMGSTIVQAFATKGNTLSSDCGVFRLDAANATDATINIKNMTIQNGYNLNSGSGIRLVQTGAGILTINLYGLKISDNKTNINGGGVSVTGNVIVNIEKCNISSNTANATGGVGGAGICINQTTAPVNLTIKNSTISNNTAAGGNGGAIYTGCGASSASSIWIENSTIYGNKNSASTKNGGGIYLTVGATSTSALTLNHCTVANNTTTAGTGGDAIYVNEAGGSNTTLVMNNSIVHKNSGSTTNGSSQVYGLITNGGVTNSIIGLPASGTWLHASGTNTHNKLDAVDADLAFAGSLTTDVTPVLFLTGASIGKSYVQTNYLSPTLTLDQLDAPRDSKPDAGAIENSWEVSTTATNTGKSWTTLAAALSKCSAGDTINVAAGTYTEKNIACNKAVTIQGAGAVTTIVQGYSGTKPNVTAACYVFLLDATYSTDATITIKNMTIQNGYNLNSGSGIRFNKTGAGTVTLNLSGLKISDNTSGATGAGIYVAGKVILNIDKCNITGNATNGAGNNNGNGGGIEILNSTIPVNVTIKNSTISNNVATKGGGAVTGGNGGGISLECGATTTSTLWIENSTITGNSTVSSTKNGGGIYVSVGSGTTSTLTLNHCTVANNTTNAGTGGDGIYVMTGGSNTTLVMNNSIVHKNSGSASNAASQVYGLITNGGVTNSIIGLPASGTWLHASGTNTHNKLDAVDADLAFAGSLSADATPVLSIGVSSIAKDYVLTNYLSPALNSDQLGNSRIGYYTDAGAYEYTTASSAPTITFATPTSVSKTYGDAQYTNAATSTSGGTITYSSGTTSVATVDASSGLVTIIGAGSSIITATQAGNSVYNSGSQTYTLTVSSKNLTAISSPISNKVYDGTNSATITGTFTGIIGSDAVNLTGTFNNANAGITKAVTATSTLGGSQAVNYIYTGSVPTGLIGNIIAKTLSIGAPSIASKQYDGSATSGTVTAGSLSGFVSSETVTVNTAAGTYAEANVGAGKSATIVYTLVNGTGLATNYSLANGSATGVITAKVLTISAPSIASKQYDGTAAAGAVTIGTLSSLVNAGEVTTTAVASNYTSANVGSYPGTSVVYTLVNGTGLATNYSLANGSATGDITAITRNVAADDYLGNSALLAGTDITVQADKELTMDYTVAVRSITVNPTGKLTIGSGVLSATNGITLQSNSNGTATLVDNNIDNPQAVTATVQQYLPQGRNWYVGTPVIADNVNNVAGKLTVTNTASSVSYWDETIGDWSNSFTGALTPGRGYIAVSNSGSSTNNFSFAGTLNSGNVNVTLTRKSTAPNPYAGFNMVANPYPSYLDAMAAINANSNIQKTIWYRTRSNQVDVLLRKYYFETVNTTSGVGTNDAGTGEVTGYIPPMQAFWVRTMLDNQQLTFTNALRYHANPTVNTVPITTTVLKAPKQSARQLVRLKVSNGIAQDEAIIYFDSNAQNNFDVFDSEKRSNNNAAIPEIYTQVDNEQLVINGLNDVVSTHDIVLGFKTGEMNTFTIKASEISNFEVGMQVYIKDLFTNSDYELTDGSSYTFSSDITDTTNRFRILFRSPSISAGIASNVAENLNVSVYKNANNQITVNCKDISNNMQILVYNAVGQKLVEKQLKSTVTVIDSQLDAGIYMVTIVNGGKNKTFKLILNN